ncbi:hypothetical protein Tco_0262792 [Tanacetum coccineum]
MAPDHSSSGPVLHEMTSDQIRSDLMAPNRQETSVDNISSDLVSNKQKTSNYDISGPVPPRKNVVSLADKIDSSQKEKVLNLSILSVHQYKTLLSLPHTILIMKICIHFNQQSHEYQWTKDHPLEQVCRSL